MADENLDPNLLAGARPELAPTAPDFAPEQTVTNPRRHGGWAASVRRGWQLNGLTGHFERGWAQDTFDATNEPSYALYPESWQRTLGATSSPEAYRAEVGRLIELATAREDREAQGFFAGLAVDIGSDPAIWGEIIGGIATGGAAAAYMRAASATGKAAGVVLGNATNSFLYAAARENRNRTSDTIKTEEERANQILIETLAGTVIGSGLAGLIAAGTKGVGAHITAKEAAADARVRERVAQDPEAKAIIQEVAQEAAAEITRRAELGRPMTTEKADKMVQRRLRERLGADPAKAEGILNRMLGATVTAAQKFPLLGRTLRSPFWDLTTGRFATGQLAARSLSNTNIKAADTQVHTMASFDTIYRDLSQGLDEVGMRLKRARNEPAAKALDRIAPGQEQGTGLMRLVNEASHYGDDIDRALKGSKKFEGVNLTEDEKALINRLAKELREDAIDPLAQRMQDANMLTSRRVDQRKAETYNTIVWDEELANQQPELFEEMLEAYSKQPGVKLSEAEREGILLSLQGGQAHRGTSTALAGGERTGQGNVSVQSQRKLMVAQNFEWQRPDGTWMRTTDLQINNADRVLDHHSNVTARRVSLIESNRTTAGAAMAKEAIEVDNDRAAIDAAIKAEEDADAVLWDMDDSQFLKEIRTGEAVKREEKLGKELEEFDKETQERKDIADERIEKLKKELEKAQEAAGEAKEAADKIAAEQKAAGPQAETLKEAQAKRVKWLEENGEELEKLELEYAERVRELERELSKVKFLKNSAAARAKAAKAAPGGPVAERLPDEIEERAILSAVSKLDKALKQQAEVAAEVLPEEQAAVEGIGSLSKEVERLRLQRADIELGVIPEGAVPDGEKTLKKEIANAREAEIPPPPEVFERLLKLNQEAEESAISAITFLEDTARNARAAADARQRTLVARAELAMEHAEAVGSGLRPGPKPQVGRMDEAKALAALEKLRAYRESRPSKPIAEWEPGSKAPEAEPAPKPDAKPDAALAEKIKEKEEVTIPRLRTEVVEPLELKVTELQQQLRELEMDIARAAGRPNPKPRRTAKTAKIEKIAAELDDRRSVRDEVKALLAERRRQRKDLVKIREAERAGLAREAEPGSLNGQRFRMSELDERVGDLVVRAARVKIMEMADAVDVANAGRRDIITMDGDLVDVPAAIAQIRAIGSEVEVLLRDRHRLSVALFRLKKLELKRGSAKLETRLEAMLKSRDRKLARLEDELASITTPSYKRLGREMSRFRREVTPSGNLEWRLSGGERVQEVADGIEEELGRSTGEVAARSENGTRWFEALRDEKEDLVRDAKTDKERAQIEEEYAETKRNIKVGIDRARTGSRLTLQPGSAEARAYQVGRTLGSTTTLGWSALAQIQDLANLLKHNALGEVTRIVFSVVTDQVKAAINMALPGGAKLTRNARIARIRELYHASEVFGSQSRYDRLVGMTQPQNRVGGSLTERGARATEKGFFIATRMGILNRELKVMAHALYENKLARIIENIDKDRVKNVEFLKRLGIRGLIDHLDTVEIVEVGGLKRVDLDALAAEAPELEAEYRRAIARFVDSDIVTPGVLDAPAWADANWMGALFFQLGSFIHANVNRNVLAMARNGSNRKTALWMGGLLVAAGVRNTVKHELKDSPARKEENGSLWAPGNGELRALRAAEALEQSGIFDAPYRINDLMGLAGLDPVGALETAAQEAFLGRELTRKKSSFRAAASAEDRLMGPGAQAVRSLGQGTSALIREAANTPDYFGLRHGDGEWSFSSAEIEGAARGIPAQNLWAFEIMGNAALKIFGPALDERGDAKSFTEAMAVKLGAKKKD
jgi:hypothetical protein